MTNTLMAENVFMKALDQTQPMIVLPEGYNRIGWQKVQK
jgi:hypothetical protein